MERKIFKVDRTIKHDLCRINGYIKPDRYFTCSTNIARKEDKSGSWGADFEIVKKPGEKSPEVVFDFNRKVTGFLYLKIKNAYNCSILVEYGPTPQSMFFKSVIELGEKENDRFILHDAFLALRYLKITLQPKALFPYESILIADEIGIRFSAYPVVYNGEFQCDNDRLNSIWDIGAYTTQLCIQKNEYSGAYPQHLDDEKKSFIKSWTNPYSPYVIWDGPRRDREVWVADLRTEALTTYYAFGLGDVIKSSLKLFADMQEKSGFMPGGGATRQRFTEYCLWWVITLCDYLRMTDDKEFIASIYPQYNSLMNWILSKMGDSFFIDVEITWMWTFLIKGIAGEAQCVLYKALKDAAYIEEYYGSKDTADYYSETGDKVRSYINNTFWDEEKGVYVERFIDKRYSDVVFADFNAYAVTLGVADHERGFRIVQYLKDNMWTEYGSATTDKKADSNPDISWAHNKAVWPFINGYEVEANFILGKDKEAFELIERCWGNMLDKGTATFWEFVGGNGEFPIEPVLKGSFHDTMDSYCHGWSGWVSYLMQRYIAGLKPVLPGFRKFEIEPHLYDLKSCKAAVATCCGRIEVSFDRSREGFFELTVTKPESFECIINLKKTISETQIIVNGTVVSMNGNIRAEGLKELVEGGITFGDRE